MKSKVITIANHLVKQGMSRSAAMVQAWITVKLRRIDTKTAVQVIAAVKGKGSAVMGYLNRQLAAAIAPLLDKGKAVASSFRAITGGAEYYLNYGLNISIAV